MVISFNPRPQTIYYPITAKHTQNKEGSTVGVAILEPENLNQAGGQGDNGSHEQSSHSCNNKEEITGTANRCNFISLSETGTYPEELYTI